MYLTGADHPNKTSARVLIEKLIADKEKLVTDVEVFQEILHRFVAIGRRDAIQPTWDALAGIVDDVFPVDHTLVGKAKELVLAYAKLSARDAIHAAVMKHHHVGRILTFDVDFDQLPGVQRLSLK